jgi:AcrR family transcriptional regulator
MTVAPAPRRRTQAERRTETMSKLAAATIDAIAELGYGGATTREICERANVSQGGLFRRFPKRQDLIVAAVLRLYEESRDWLADLLDRLATGTTVEEFTRVLVSVRDFLARPRTMVFLEVIAAARSDPDLREALGPLHDGQLEAIRTAAVASPVIAAMPSVDQLAYIELVQHDLWVEALWSTVLPSIPDDRKLAGLARLGIALGSAATA